MRPPQLTERVRRPEERSALRSGRGFTIIELMISIGILVILVSVAAPSMSSLVRDQRVKTATFDVYSSLAYARSEAIKRNANVTITQTLPGSEWGGGWQIDIVPPSATSLKTQDAFSKVSISGPAVAVIYQRDGRISGPAAPMFVVKSAEDNTVTARCVRVDLSGRPNIKVDTNKDPSDGCQ